MLRRPTSELLGKPGFQKKERGYKEDPYVFLSETDDVCQSIKTYYGLSDEFPLDQLLARTRVGKKRNLYLASKLVKELTIRNESSIKIINIGMKVLARYDHPSALCPFRLCQEGAQTFAPLVSRHRVEVTLEDLVRLLREPNPLTCSLSPQTQATVEQLGVVGPALLEYIPEQKSATVKSSPIWVSGWLAARSLRLYMGREERLHYLAMLGREPPESLSLKAISGKDARDSLWEEEGEEREEGKREGEDEREEDAEDS